MEIGREGGREGGRGREREGGREGEREREGEGGRGREGGREEKHRNMFCKNAEPKFMWLTGKICLRFKHF